MKVIPARASLALLLLFSLTDPRVLADEASRPTQLAGQWRLVAPALDCGVTLDIAADGDSVLRNNTEVVRKRLDLANAKWSDGAWQVESQDVGKQGSGGCQIPETSGAPGFERHSAARLLAQGRRLALCVEGTAGECRQTFERVGGAMPPSSQSPLQMAAERAIRVSMPEQPGLFELSAHPVASIVTLGDASLPAALGSTCTSVMGWYGLETTSGNMDQWIIAVCDDGAAWTRATLAARTSETVVGWARGKHDERDTLPFGMSFVSEHLSDGANVTSFPDTVRGVDAAVPLETAVWVVSNERRMVVVQLLSFNGCEPKHPHTALALCKDRGLALRRIATALALDPASRQ